jgi:cytochrome c peroxidase
MQHITTVIFVFIALISTTLALYLLPEPYQSKQVSLINDADHVTIELSKQAITPLVMPINLDANMVQLGHQLFIDVRLSRDNSISCNSCHLLNTYGVDNLAKSIGVDEQIGRKNTPTVFNSSLNMRQEWTGKIKTLEAQVSMPLNNPIEMDSSWELVISKLQADPIYAHQFDALFIDGITAQNISYAIATFERSLITVNSPFDRWLQGDANAISEQAKQGYESFQQYGCIACHQGAGIGGNMFGRLGAVKDYFADRGYITAEDYGRFNVTNQEKDRFKFKVPSLRNVAHTAPYFHDGSVSQLNEAIKKMSYYQLGVTMDATTIANIAAFLESLTGQHPITARVDIP